MHLPDVLVGTSPKSCNNKVTVNIRQGPALNYLHNNTIGAKDKQ